MKRTNARTGGPHPATGQGKHKNHTLTIIVPPPAFLLLQAVAMNEGKQTVEEWAAGAIAEAMRPIAAGWADEGCAALHNFFTPEKEEA